VWSGKWSGRAASRVDHEIPDFVGVGMEDEAHVGGRDEPVTPFEFAVELLGAPARTAGEDPKLEVFPRYRTADDLFEDFGAVADIESGGDGRMLLIVFRRVVDDKQSVPFDGASGINLHVAFGEFEVPLEGLIDFDSGGTIDDQAHRSLIVVFDDEDDTLEEIGVPEILPRYQKMPCQRLGHDSEILLLFPIKGRDSRW